MGLKKRLVVAFLILLIVPILLIAVTVAAAMSMNRGTVGSQQYIREEVNGNIYYFTTEGTAPEAAPQIKLPILQTFFFLMVVIVCTAMVLVIWLYRSIIRPLSVLRMATENIRQGNLDFTVTGHSDDELGQLCIDFENMRGRLKEQIDARIKYEQDTIDLISNISHDLKTPLTAIKGYTEGILDGVADTDEKRNKYLRTIYTKAADMQSLVDELSDYTKLDSNIIPYNFSNVNVNSFFSDCVDELSLDTEVKNITLTYNGNVDDDQTVIADAEQLRRVINNIIGNSVKYMDKPEGHIEIRSFLDGDFVRFEIEDNAAGIAETDLPHIFERFYRADSSRGTRKGGTGLGLAISKMIIEDHGGTISARSKLGEGTTFIFTVPRCTKGNCYEEVEDAEYSRVEATKEPARRRLHS
ncbi:MAG: HAMP domain-containing histidine kinase [Lachnospiraceae bacterium]|nr:HAMP domain-containing histidine kinase [Lachnospiraceae bacterium]